MYLRNHIRIYLFLELVKRSHGKTSQSTCVLQQLGLTEVVNRSHDPGQPGFAGRYEPR